MKKALKRKIVYIPLIAIVILIGWFFLRSGKSSTALATTEVLRSTLVQEVSVSGTVKATEAVELAFEKSGRIQRINADVGEKTYQGAVLISLENGVESSALEDAQAKLASKQAHYDDLKRGGRPEEVRVKETGLAKAGSDLAADYATVPNLTLDAFNKADSAVHEQADTLFSNALSSNPRLSFNSSDQQAVFDAESGRFTVETVLNNFKKMAQSQMSSDNDKEADLSAAKDGLVVINDFLLKTSRALNAATNLSSTALATDKDALSTARTNINTILSDITDQIQTIATQKITVETAANELELTKVGATAEVLAGALADIKSADANVKNAQAVLAKTYIVSPISGIVTRQDAKVGEIAGASVTLTAVASGNFKIEAFIPEVDVAKIAVGNTSSITLDAYGSDISFPAHVVKIDPAETVIDGVSTYKTALEFDKPDERIRSGMTANTTVRAAARENVLAVPQRAIYDKSGKKFVKILRADKTAEEREVTAGLKGSDGLTEILNGVSEGEQVVTSR